MDQLNLDRPIAFFDLEATGTDPEEARIFQIAITRFVGDGEPETFRNLVDPGVAIPEEVETLTGITTQEATLAPTLGSLSGEIRRHLNGADFAGYNIKGYDLPLLKNELDRAGASLPPPEDRTVLDVYEIEKQFRSLSLSAVYERHMGEPLEGAHDAMEDVRGTAEVLISQLEEFGLDPNPAAIVDEMSDGYIDPKRRLFEDENGDVRFDFGKFEDQQPTLAWVVKNEPSYIEWMLDTIDDLRPVLTERLEDLGVTVSDDSLVSAPGAKEAETTPF